MEFLEKYQIEIYVDETYRSGSTDNLNTYNFEYFNETEYQLTTQIGIKLYENGNIKYSAIIGSDCGATTVHENSTIIEENRILICCSNTIFCLSKPELKLLWKTVADEITCFEILKKEDFYIVHGEIEITKLNNEGEILWQKSGADIFTNMNEKDNLEITEKYIIAKDWDNRIYKFNYDGNEFTDMQQFK
jgi:hypothetical protein